MEFLNKIGDTLKSKVVAYVAIAIFSILIARFEKVYGWITDAQDKEEADKIVTIIINSPEVAEKMTIMMTSPEVLGKVFATETLKNFTLDQQDKMHKAIASGIVQDTTLKTGMRTQISIIADCNTKTVPEHLGRMVKAWTREDIVLKSKLDSYVKRLAKLHVEEEIRSHRGNARGTNISD